MKSTKDDCKKNTKFNSNSKVEEKDMKGDVSSLIVALKSYGEGEMTIWKCKLCDRESANTKRLKTHIYSDHRKELKSSEALN